MARPRWSCHAPPVPGWVPQALLSLVLSGLLLHGMLAWWEQQISGCFLDDVVSSHRTPGYQHCKNRLKIFGSVEAETMLMLSMGGMSYVLALVRLLVAARRVLPLARTWCRVSQLAILLRKAARSASDTLWSHPPNPEVARVLSEAEAMRLRQAGAQLRMLSILAALLLCVNAQRARQRTERRDYRLMYICDSEAIPLFSFGMVAILFDAVPSFLTSSALDKANILLSAMWAWKSAVMGQDYFYYNSTWISMCRLVQALVCGNARLSVFLHFGVSLVSAICAWSVAKAEHPTNFWASLEVYKECWNCALLSMVSWIFEQRRLAEAEARVNVKRSANTSHLVFNLLASMCEAVLKLDADLRLIEPCPQLACLLLRQGPLAAGIRFSDLMSADDTERFRRSLQSPGREVATDRTKPAAALHVDLHDGSNQKFAAEVFSSCVLDVDDQPVYLIGIKEDRERQGPWNDQVAPLRGMGVPAIPVPARADPSASESEVRSSLSSVSDSSDGDNGEVIVWVDASRTGGLRVLGHSSGFALLGGSLGPCRSLRDWMRDGDADVFANWLYSGDADLYNIQVNLHPPEVHGRYAARCSCSQAAESGGGPPEAPPGANPVCLRLSHVKFKANRPKPPPHNSQEGAARLAEQASGIGDLPEDAGEGPAPQSGAGDAGRGGGGGGSGGVPQLEEGTELVAFWFRAASRNLKIVEVSEHAGPCRNLFRAKTNLRMWLEQPDVFVNTVLACGTDSERGDQQTRTAGQFTFKEPNADAAPLEFIAHVEVLQVTGPTVTGRPCCIGLRLVRFLQPPGGEVADLASRAEGSGTATGSTEIVML